MPKIADEFKSERPAPSLGTPVKAAPRPVAKPAPMAPRNVAPAPMAQRAAAPATKTANPQQSVLADKLRSQREAAERLAAQRVSAARERAEGKITTDPKLSTPPAGARPAGGAKPKFSFADEPGPTFQPRQSSGNGLPPLLPPKPALGGERPAGFSARPVGYGAAGNTYRQEPPPGYRPIDPSTGYAGRPQPSARNYPPLGGAGGPALPQRRQAPPPAYDERYYPEEEDYRGDARLARSMARQQPLADEGDDVFDDAPATAPQGRRRASAAEYNAAYREAETEYAEPRRRSGGPWLLLFALLLAAVATGGIVWYYQTKIKPVATNTSTGGTTTTETVPVVNAPEQAVKTEAETTAEQPADAQPASKKQIYDRIVGDQEVLGSAALAPTEQTPIQPEPQDAQTGTELIPAPAGGQGTDDAEPLQLPPPPGEEGSNTQGNLNGTQVQPASIESASKDAGSESIGSLVQQSATETQAAIGTPSTASGDGSGNSTNSGGGVASATTTQDPVPQMESISDEPVAADTEAAAPEIKKPAAEPKKVTAKAEKKPAKAKPKAQTEEALGEEPVVLVPPSQDGQTASTEVIDIGGGSAVAQDADTGGTATTAEPKKKKTIFDLFKGKDANSGGAAPAQEETQVASAEPLDTAPAQKQPAKSTTAKTTGGSGYVAQLASFRSQGEAQAEFNRLQGKYPGVLGGQRANISTATVAGSTRYRLGVGPLASRDAAQQICGSLLASGERDCLVRKQ